MVLMMMMTTMTKIIIIIINAGRVSSVGIPTRYGLDDPGSNSGGGEIHRTHPDQPWVPPSFLYDWDRGIPGVKRQGRGVDHSLPSRAEVKERVEQYFYSPLGLHGVFCGEGT